MSNGKQSKGTQALNPLLAITLIPFLPIDRSGGGKIRSEEKTVKEVPREHKHRHHHHHHHHHHKSEDSSKSPRHSAESSRNVRSSGEYKSAKRSAEYQSARSSADVPRSDRNREYIGMERDVKAERSSRR
ncbi:hypothetical protein B0A55_00935 [Friedmanniomyces simplex]|uniref:Uncharacterized protein n=1 Tax=Friedmanniomyces simplex TaxID=329884 RepID=A0A4U0Y143_9PEZI|nr:hypothetical protein B0A55_00935 [Friedmanniomyces simplex]